MLRARSLGCLLLLTLAPACRAARDEPARVEVNDTRPRQPQSPQPPSAREADPARYGVVETFEREDARSRVVDGVRTIGTCDDAQRSAGVARFTIAHFNDLQARYSDLLQGRSRYAYIAGYLRKIKAAVPATLVLDAGDDYEKGAISELYSTGETTRRMVQALPIDVRTIGNHDFAYGEASVLRDLRLSAHPVLAANVRHAELSDAEQPFRSFVRVDVGCVKVGIIGLVTQNYGADDQPTNLPYDGVFVHDDRYAQVLQREVTAHRDEVDVLIALTHLGYLDDTKLALNLAARGVDLIVGAHTEDLLTEPLPATRSDGSRTWIVQAGHFGQTLGRADVAFRVRDRKVTIERYAIVDVDASLPHADDVAELAARLEHEAAPDAREVIGITRSELSAGGDMALLVRRAAHEVWGVDGVVVGRDLFWQGLPRGAITLQRLYDSVLSQRQPAGTPGFSSLWVVELGGRELTALRNRMHATLYEMFTPSPIDPEKRYRIALDKRAISYPRIVFGEGAKLPDATFGGELIDVLEAYARSRTARNEPLD